MPTLLARCTTVGATPVNVPQMLLPEDPMVATPGTKGVDEACSVVSSWNGTFDATSKGAHVSEPLLTFIAVDSRMT